MKRKENDSLPQPGHLHLGSVEPNLQLSPRHLHIPDMVNRPIQQGDLGRFLVRRGKGFLKATIALSELVTTTLFGFDALLADFFASGWGTIGDE
jgi:hypothetical protein